jgi:hypothetical protein
MDVRAPRLARLKQVHGTTVVTHRRGAPAPGEAVQPEGDIVVSDVPGLALAIQTADCVPILMADPRLGVVAAVHAGWRGLSEHAPVTAVERMSRDFGTRAEDLVVAIGPAIASCCYEVGQDVRERFEHAAFNAGQLDAWFSGEPVASVNNPAMAALPAARRITGSLTPVGRRVTSSFRPVFRADRCSSAVCVRRAIRMCSARTGATARPQGEWRRPSVLSTLDFRD